MWGSSLISEIPGGSGEKKSSWVKTLYEMTIQDLFRVWECPKLLSAPIQFSSKNKLSFFSRLTLCPHSWTSPFHSASFPTTALPSCSEDARIDICHFDFADEEEEEILVVGLLQSGNEFFSVVLIFSRHQDTKNGEICLQDLSHI